MMEDETTMRVLTFDERAMNSLRWLAAQRGLVEDPEGRWIARVIRYALATDTVLIEHLRGGGRVELVDSDDECRVGLDLELTSEPAAAGEQEGEDG